MTERTFGARPHPYIRPELEVMAAQSGDDDDFWEDEDEEESESTDTRQPDLKPCPFCGAGREDLLILDRQDYGMYWKTGIYCHGCRSTILYDSDTDDEDRMLKDAVAKWNRRHKRMIYEAIAGSRYGSYPSPKGKGKDYYQMRMSNGDVICIDTDPSRFTGDWAIVRDHWIADGGR